MGEGVSHRRVGTVGRGGVASAPALTSPGTLTGMEQERQRWDRSEVIRLLLEEGQDLDGATRAVPSLVVGGRKDVIAIACHHVGSASDS